MLVRNLRLAMGVTLAATFLLTAPGATPAAAAQVRTVGPGPECSFSELQDALDAVQVLDPAVVLRLSRDVDHFTGGTYEIDMSQWDLTVDLTIRGGYESCGIDEPPFGQTSLDADGNGRVLSIKYNVDDSAPPRVVNLENLAIMGGEASQSGGGILVEGHSGRQRVWLRSVGFVDNHTDSDGGAIALLDTAGRESETNNVWFVLDDQSTISFNSAVTGSGGGVACDKSFGSNTGVVALGGPIFQNEAHSGGGLAAWGCTLRAYNSISNNNSFGVGGGVALLGGATLTMSNASKPIDGITLGESSSAGIAGNQSELHGGGAFVGGLASSKGRLELTNARIVDNHAGFAGGGLFMGKNSELHMHGTSEADCPGAECSRLSRNTANIHGENGNFGGGALALNSASAKVEKTFIQENGSGGSASAVTLVQEQGDPPIVEPGPEASLRLESVLMSGNQGAEALIAGTDSVHLEISFSTLSGNQQPDSDLILIEQTDPENQALVELHNSILWEPEASSIIESNGSGDFIARCLIGHVAAGGSGIAITEFYSHIDPAFHNPEVGDFRLKHDSPAIDYCDGSQFEEPPPETDLFNQPRGLVYDLPIIEAPNAQGGSHDLGAFERQPDALFHDRLE